MGHIERRNGRWRARYRDPLGRQLSETFTRKLDAERFLREVQVDIERGRWLDPRGAETTVKEWSEEFLSLARRLAPTTQQTYKRLGELIGLRRARIDLGLRKIRVTEQLIRMSAGGWLRNEPKTPEKLAELVATTG